MAPTNPRITGHAFLTGMYADGHFPDHLIDKAVAILLRLCERVEQERPADLAALYLLTHDATDELNDLQDEFYEAGSELETVARDLLAGDFAFVADAYGFPGADIEELVATRDW
ncbi:DUF5713 family protein [Actinomadura parmotrematis]|uniref:MafI family immunity protein n=1 Tax=Actinomadura parmotrematis TaxID=2864039 RepID=A0ABS7FRI3_9ACTN|nr:DUF5713 family protein [Actinomadura parmotrematis]MBW8482992.1 hypothetical protein [Actinomadura parmotrematis]